MLAEVLRVSAQYAIGVSGDVYFRDDGDVTCGCISDEFTNLVLRVVLLSLGELWVAVYLYAEPLVVREV